MNSKLAIFEDYKIRRVYDEDTETWYFSVVDILQALLQQPDYQTARKYWNKLRERLSKEGSESVTNCHRLFCPIGNPSRLRRRSFRSKPSTGSAIPEETAHPHGGKI